MEVPLLTLNYLKRESRSNFEWIPELNIGKDGNNIDIVCIRDGMLFIGEAKSENEIDPKQFTVYENICKRLKPDGIVFATSEQKWKKGTEDRIEKLKDWFKGDVIVLTSRELYPSQPNETT